MEDVIASKEWPDRPKDRVDATASRRGYGRTSSCGSGRSRPPPARPGTITAGWGDNIVAVMRFDPSPISIKVGDTVTWKPGSPYEPYPFPANSFSLKFPMAGTYGYVCVLHPGMNGTVAVT